MRPMKFLNALSHEIWAAAQLAPGEGIVDGVARVDALLREALAALKAENDMLRESLKDADNELDWLDEDIGIGCDHSAGVCTCDYWNMRRKMKAALSKENSSRSIRARAEGMD